MDTFIARKTVFDNFSLPLVYLSNPYLLISYLLEYFTYTKRHTSISLAVEKKYVKVCLILCADDIVVFANSSSELQKSLDLLFDYCQRWKLVVNTSMTKSRTFRKGGRLPQGLEFYYNNIWIETVNKFSYLCIVFTDGGSISETQNTLSRKAFKAIFKLNTYLYKFTNV